MGIIGNIAGLVSFVCFILVLIKIFKDKEKNGVLHGIIGIVTCGLWALIWGWMNVGRYNNKNVMLAWTVCIVLSMVFSGAAVMSALSGGAGG